jgi:flagellar biosynthesis/type III secretory pathway chaperone
MMELLFSLSDLLGEEKKVFEILHQILARESDAVASHNFELLNEAVKEKEIEALNLRFLEKKREKLITAIAHQIDRSKDDVSMPLLIAMADDSCALKLTDSWQELTRVVKKVKCLVRKNKELMENSLHFVKDAVLLLERISVCNAIYFRTGRINQKQLAGRVLRGSI